MKALALLVIFLGFASFFWGRRRYFVRSAATTRYRGGLGPAGTLFSLVDILLILLDSRFGGVYFVLGLFMSIASVALFWWAVFSFEERRPRIAYTLDGCDFLNRNGPYAYIRHPFYASYLLLWIAVIFFLAPGLKAAFAAVPAIVMMVLYYRAAVDEEARFMASELSRSYQAYAQATGMFVPRLNSLLGKRNS